MIALYEALRFMMKAAGKAMPRIRFPGDAPLALDHDLFHAAVQRKVRAGRTPRFALEDYFRPPTEVLRVRDRAALMELIRVVDVDLAYDYAEGIERAALELRTTMANDHPHELILLEEVTSVASSDHAARFDRFTDWTGWIHIDSVPHVGNAVDAAVDAVLEVTP